MSIQSIIKLFTSGGQTFLHSLNMFNQVASKALLVSFAAFVLIFGLLFVKKSDHYDRYVGKKWIITSLLSGINTSKDKKIEWVLPDDSRVEIYASEVLASKEVQKTLTRVKKAFLSAFLQSGFLYLIVFGVVARGLYRRGKKQGDSKVIRGQVLVSPKTLIKEIKKGPLSPYKIANIPMPFNSETQHIQFVGTTGSGKTVAIRELLSVIRARGERAIIYDKGGTYISKFYQEGKDAILNPLDERSFSWDVWQECEDKADFEAIAEALMPMPATSAIDPFWVNAARMIFVSAANELKKNPNRSNLLLLQYLLTKNAGSIYELLKHTESESLVSDKVEKTAINIKAVMATYLKSLAYLKAEGEFFSISKWIRNEDSQDFLFISSNERKHPTLRPLISAWLNTAAKELLSLKPKDNRRVWFILDELATLHQLPFLELVLSESRKFGGCFVMGYHGISQLRKIYGSDGASNLSNFCSTQVFMRLIDAVNSQWASDNIGTCEIEEVNEGISYGANTIRDGVSISRSLKEKKVVLPSEVAKLEDLEAYIKMKGNLPCAKVKLNYVHYEDINPDFVERVGEKDALAREVESLVDKYEDPTIAKSHDELLDEKPHSDNKEKKKEAEKEDDKELYAYV
jgi:type IV conjugative transfer system coupling protein TraD